MRDEMFQHCASLGSLMNFSEQHSTIRYLWSNANWKQHTTVTHMHKGVEKCKRSELDKQHLYSLKKKKKKKTVED